MRASIMRHNHTKAFSTVSTWFEAVEKVDLPNQPETVDPSRTRPKRAEQESATCSYESHLINMFLLKTWYSSEGFVLFL